jgi:hypothetical protein
MPLEYTGEPALGYAGMRKMGLSSGGKIVKKQSV